MPAFQLGAPLASSPKRLMHSHHAGVVPDDQIAGLVPFDGHDVLGLSRMV